MPSQKKATKGSGKKVSSNKQMSGGEKRSLVKTPSTAPPPKSPSLTSLPAADVSGSPKKQAAPPSRKASKTDKHSGAGHDGAAKKGGAGGRYAWGREGDDGDEGGAMDAGDPNYDDETPTKTTKTTQIATAAPASPTKPSTATPAAAKDAGIVAEVAKEVAKIAVKVSELTKIVDVMIGGKAAATSTTNDSVCSCCSRLFVVKEKGVWICWHCDPSNNTNWHCHCVKPSHALYPPLPPLSSLPPLPTIKH